MSGERLYEGAPLSEKYSYGKNKQPGAGGAGAGLHRSSRQPSFNSHDHLPHHGSVHQPSTPGSTMSRDYSYGGTGEVSKDWYRELDQDLYDLNKNIAKLNSMDTSPQSGGSYQIPSTAYSAPNTPRTPRRQMQVVPPQYQTLQPEMAPESMPQYQDVHQDRMFKMDFDMKDFNPDDVNLSLKDKELKIEARKKTYGTKGEKVSTMERKSRVRIPETVDASQLRAKLSQENGILTIEAPSIDSQMDMSDPKHTVSDGEEVYRRYRQPPAYNHFAYDQIPIHDGTNRPRRRTTTSSSDYPIRTSTLQKKPQTPRQHPAPHHNHQQPHTSSHYQYDTLPSSSSHDTTSIPIKNFSLSRERGRSTKAEERQTSIYGTLPRSQSPGKRRSRSVGPHRYNDPNRSMDAVDYYDTEHRTARGGNQPSPVRTTSIRANTLQKYPSRNNTRERRIAVSMFIGEGFRTDQLLVKNVIPFDRFVVHAAPDGWQRHKEYRKVFNWPTPVEASSISAFLRPDGTLTVTALTLDDD